MGEGARTSKVMAVGNKVPSVFMIKHASDGEPVKQPDTDGSMAEVWHDLLFIRWPVDPQLRRSRIPDGLTLDTYEGQAWIGMVPFVPAAGGIV